MTDFIKGRGAKNNPSNRFEEIHRELKADFYLSDVNPEDYSKVKTVFIKDNAKSILTKNDSPDIGFEYSLNPYRGCEHGCIYCYARPTHEYLGFSLGVDFETKILVKEHAPELLRKELSSAKWEPTLIMMSGATDLYQPIERKLELSRRCLEVLAEFQNPVFIVTKNALITRDLDILTNLAKVNCIGVYLSITTLDDDLCGKLEPRTSRPGLRLKTIETLAKAGIPVGVNVAPILPGLTDHEVPEILKAARNAGAISASYVLLRLPYGIKELLATWLETHYPEKKNKVLSLVREVRGGNLNETQFGLRFKGQGEYAKQISALFKVHFKRLGFTENAFKLETEHFQKPKGPQVEMDF